MEEKLLNLTPIYLQNADNILNTLLFMCLDQGHDFHDGSARTKTNDGKSTWVDLDLSGKGYLNKISISDFQNNYSPTDPETRKTINAEYIFGKGDFIKGLLNTTFIGGNGAYGLVAIDENVYSSLGSDDNNIINIIKTSISNQIDVELVYHDNKYYIVTRNDCQGESGITITISESNGIKNNILFLPFYQRVYNGDMHKLWTFNTKKHIFIVELSNIDIIKEDTKFKIENAVFNCKKFTTIDLIVPQYYLNFKDFLEANKYDKLKLDKLKELNDYQKIEMFNKFSQAIFNGFYSESNEHDNSDSIDNGTIKYEIEQDGIGRFHIKENNNILNCIPRGTKYYFQDCQKPIFKFFLDLLFKYQKPFIHPNYLVNETINNAKEYISDKLLENDNALLNEYNKNKLNLIEVDKNDQNFISKQYGFITDTNIGSGAAKSTSDILIDSLNNVDETTTCPIVGGVRGDLAFLGLDTEDPDVKSIENNGQFNKLLEGNIKQVYKKILNDEEKISEFTKYLKSIYPDKSSKIDEILFKQRTPKEIKEEIITEQQEQPIFKKRRLDESIEKATTTIEDVTPVTLPVEKIIEPMEISKEPFNNIDNVNSIFDLNLEKSELESNTFKNINSASTNRPFNDYINNYSNKLQLYYDYIPQKQEKMTDTKYFSNCWQSTDFYQSGGSDYPFKFTVASGSLDSSALGGQSIPQYHPPEVDVYMPIFELGGSGTLKGIIVRMVFVKEVLNNGINSKSQVIIFCHFVYVDFEKTEIPPPSDYNDYSIKIKALLQYAVENTVLIKNDSECIDIEKLKQNELLNTEKDIDFKLNFYAPNDINKTTPIANTKWYKYYTFTQGPTVKDSIVIPSNFNSVELVKLKAQFDYVATGILNVGENLIQNSEKLRSVFSGQDGQLLFIKLFLIRNKYTGDKSRSTDTLFLNQTEYLEGVQISNDENTLYNSQMFGLNTIWSTSKKSVYYMTPYITPTNKMTITNGVYIDKLCNGLKENPNNKTTAKRENKASLEINEDSITKQEIREEILEKFNTEFFNKYQECFEPKNKGNTELDNLIITLVDAIFIFNYKLRQFYDNFLNSCPINEQQLKDIISEYKTSIATTPDNFDERYNNLSRINKIIKYGDKYLKTGIIGDFYMFCQECKIVEELDVQLFAQLKKLVSYLIKPNNCGYSPNELYKLLLFINKNFPFWVRLIVKNYRLNAFKKYCQVINRIIPELKSIIELENLSPVTPNAKNKLKKFIDARINQLNGTSKEAEDSTIKACFKESIDASEVAEKSTGRVSRTVAKTSPSSASESISPINCLQTEQFVDEVYLKEITPDDIESYSNEERKLIIEMNDKKYIKTTLELLEKLKTGNLTFDKQSIKDLYEQPLTPEQINEINQKAENIEREKIFLKTKPVPTGQTERIAESLDIGAPIGGDIRREPTNIAEKYLMDNSEIKNNYDNINLSDNFDKKTTSILNIVESPEKSRQIISKEKLIDFYSNSYKCNIGNYLKSFIFKIKQINKLFPNYKIDINEDDVKNIIVKILLQYINFINLSYSPAITSDIILNDLNNVDDSYDIEKMNYILNLYSKQLNLYFYISNILTSEMNSRELIDTLNDSISDYQFALLKLPFLKYQLIDLIKITIPMEINENIFDNVNLDNVEGGSYKKLNKSFKRKYTLKQRKTKKHTNKNNRITIKKKVNKIKKNTRRQ
jgi:hypothetical protein